MVELRFIIIAFKVSAPMLRALFSGQAGIRRAAFIFDAKMVFNVLAVAAL